MKKVVILMVFLLTGFVQNIEAQELETEIELIESLLGKAKKDFVTDNITFPPLSSSEFWTLYNAYEIKRKQLARQRVKLIGQYVFLYAEGDNETEGQFMNDVFKLRRQSEKNLKQFYKKIAKKVSPTSAMQFLQLEEYVRNGVDKILYDRLPLKR